jgi:hypothetical protein
VNPIYLTVLAEYREEMEKRAEAVEAQESSHLVQRCDPFRKQNPCGAEIPR